MSAVDALLYPSFALGAHGAIAAICTAVPRLCVELWDAVRAGDHKQALGLHERLLPVWNAIFQDNLPANVKHCLGLQGRPGGCPRADAGDVEGSGRSDPPGADQRGRPVARLQPALSASYGGLRGSASAGGGDGSNRASGTSWWNRLDSRW